jgi:predicted GNAT family acetyltransferase
MTDQDETGAQPAPTTTHAGWGAGHPRLLVASEYDRHIHEITVDLTRIGSSVDVELVLPDADPVHATVTHDSTDEYVLTMFGEGETNALAWERADADSARLEILRTGAHFTAGPWRLVFARDEFADHGRPYGGREGGEGAHQKRQPAPPDYSAQHPRSAMLNLDEAQHPVSPEDRRRQEKMRSLGSVVLLDAAADGAGPRKGGLRVVDDMEAGIYDAIVDDVEAGGVTYNTVGDDRVVVLAVSVYPEFRGQGIATDLIRYVLDDIRAQGKTVTNYCPVVNTFIDRNPEYADLIDEEHPGTLGPREHS